MPSEPKNKQSGIHISKNNKTWKTMWSGLKSTDNYSGDLKDGYVGLSVFFNSESQKSKPELEVKRIPNAVNIKWLGKSETIYMHDTTNFVASLIDTKDAKVIKSIESKGKSQVKRNKPFGKIFKK